MMCKNFSNDNNEGGGGVVGAEGGGGAASASAASGSRSGGGESTRGLKKGPWTATEDAILMEYVKKHGEGNWNAVQKNSGLARCGKSCRLRWANHLRPNLKKGSFTPDEERIIIELHAKLGNKWARMASQVIIHSPSLSLSATTLLDAYPRTRIYLYVYIHDDEFHVSFSFRFGSILGGCYYVIALTVGFIVRYLSHT